MRDPEPNSQTEAMEANQRLRAENAALRALVEVSRESARLQALRATLRDEGWRPENAGTPSRLVRRLLRLIRAVLPARAQAALRRHGLAMQAYYALRIAEAQGVEALLARVTTRWRMRRRATRRRAAPPGTEPAVYRATPDPATRAALLPSVLIIADLVIPQCTKYRVWQKQAQIEALGRACHVADWRKPEGARAALQLCTDVIFYRVPATPETLALIAEARRLGLDPWWEADDLIFDETLYQQNRNLDTLEPDLRRAVLAGVAPYRAAMLACGRAIASTEGLAAAMRAAGVSETRVIENALDAETLTVTAALRARGERPADGQVVIGYGSGSKAHDADFAEAAPALAAVLRARPEARLRIMGELTLPACLTEFGDRVERLPPLPYAAYLEQLAACDISLAPLEPTRFNDAKSAIKFIEAAMLGLPSVCSPRKAFRAAITDGVDGLLADTGGAWEAALLRLIDDPAGRRRIGAAALAGVLARYAPEAMRPQVAAVFPPPALRSPKLRVLVVNVFFWPRSFGGATIVAEEMARRLHARPDTEVVVFTSEVRAADAPGALLRYAEGDLPVIGVRLPPDGDRILDFDNPGIAEAFDAVLEAVQPDVVHFHAVQGLGAAVTRRCLERRIPYVVTLHDCWWLCDRQFMVRPDGTSCPQMRIDTRVCEACMPRVPYLHERLDMLLHALHGAALLLSPSRTHRDLYVANGLPPERVMVNRNGIRLPERPRGQRRAGVLRFGYVGGVGPIKGFPLIRAAFESLPRGDYELVIVDNTLNLGYASVDVSGWRARGQIRLVPAYRQEEMDAFFAGIDVLLFPSQWRESFGLTVREALARDVWVIATRGGAAEEDIIDGVNGTLIPLDGRHEKLRDAIAALLDAPERLASFVNPAKETLTGYDAQAEELRGMLAAVATNG
ncbi:MAG TPA: glycosyltransferase [Acetobacteraceae bacterium]|nr:glycosyltransferase [Acetobacteraceae bacterium]